MSTTGGTTSPGDGSNPTAPVRLPSSGSTSEPAGTPAGASAVATSTATAPAPGAQAGAQTQPATAATAAGRPAAGRSRRVKLTVSRVDPWSTMKLSFLLSVALGIAFVIMTFVLWTILSGMGVFDQIDSVVGQVLQGSTSASKFSIMSFVGLGRVLSLSIVIAVIDVVLMTAISTLGAFLYNVCSALVGGLQLTLTDD